MTDEENAANAELLRWAKVAYDVLSEIHAQYLPEDGDSPLLEGLAKAIEKGECARETDKRPRRLGLWRTASEKE